MQQPDFALQCGVSGLFLSDVAAADFAVIAVTCDKARALKLADEMAAASVRASMVRKYPSFDWQAVPVTHSLVG